MTLLTSLLATLAAKVKNIPAGTITATTVQGAINELDSNKAAITYVDSSIAAAIVGVFSFRGTHDASGNLFPTTGGSGTAGAVRKADVWKVSVAGTLGGVAVNANDTLYALVNSPGQTAGNWDIVESNIGYTPENAANKDTDSAFAANSDTRYPSQKAVNTALNLKAPLAAPTLTGIVTGGSRIKYGTNVESLSGNKTITTNDVQVQLLNPNGANRDVTLYATPATSDSFVFKNTGSAGNNLVLKNNAGTTLITLANNVAAGVVYDGTNWQLV